jgi:hypothetical protein
MCDDNMHLNGLKQKGVTKLLSICINVLYICIGHFVRGCIFSAPRRQPAVIQTRGIKSYKDYNHPDIYFKYTLHIKMIYLLYHLQFIYYIYKDFKYILYIDGGVSVDYALIFINICIPFISQGTE